MKQAAARSLAFAVVMLLSGCISTPEEFSSPSMTPGPGSWSVDEADIEAFETWIGKVSELFPRDCASTHGNLNQSEQLNGLPMHFLLLEARLDRCTALHTPWWAADESTPTMLADESWESKLRDELEEAHMLHQKLGETLGNWSERPRSVVEWELFAWMMLEHQRLQSLLYKSIPFSWNNVNESAAATSAWAALNSVHRIQFRSVMLTEWQKVPYSGNVTLCPPERLRSAAHDVLPQAQGVLAQAQATSSVAGSRYIPVLADILIPRIAELSAQGWAPALARYAGEMAWVSEYVAGRDSVATASQQELRAQLNEFLAGGVTPGIVDQVVGLSTVIDLDSDSARQPYVLHQASTLYVLTSAVAEHCGLDA